MDCPNYIFRNFPNVKETFYTRIGIIVWMIDYIRINIIECNVIQQNERVQALTHTFISRKLFQ